MNYSPDVSDPSIQATPDFQLLTGSLDRQTDHRTSSDDPSEGRAATRLRIVEPAGLWVEDGSPRSMDSKKNECESVADRVVVKNISMTGIGLISQEPLAIRQVFEINIRGFLINATVVRCRPLARSCYDIGATINWAKPTT